MTRGRRREHYQWNMDIIGVTDITAEVELLSSIVTFFKRIGITSADVGFKVSSQKVLQEVLKCYSIPANLFGKVSIIIDKIEKVPVDEIKKELNLVGVSEEAIQELLRVLSGFDRKGKLRAICGGGRYDRLFSTFGADDVPACGFGFGDAVIMELLKDKGLLPELSLKVENIVCTLDLDLQGAAAMVATILREKGKSVDLVLESKPLK